MRCIGDLEPWKLTVNIIIHQDIVNGLKAYLEEANTLWRQPGYMKELPISLWDIHVIRGLPIDGSPYKEVVLEAVEITGANETNERFIHRTCEYLFIAFQHLQEGETHIPRVPLSKWIKFWCKRSLRYEPTPARKEKKSARLKSTYNPTGAILE
ncbi:hypothetical protein RND71_023425 [Anisodus tanguticus]|uniref:Uncharacterized protein n=1 Tax=Anisodus tanguticus TaxID=243964 RepID=A0AAE1RT28_9SOLA|nr:hypothetical protein RND71_023425 [Anisodus tanguticus]